MIKIIKNLVEELFKTKQKVFNIKSKTYTISHEHTAKWVSIDAGQ